MVKLCYKCIKGKMCKATGWNLHNHDRSNTVSEVFVKKKKKELMKKLFPYSANAVSAPLNDKLCGNMESNELL